jgi:phospholipase C
MVANGRAAQIGGASGKIKHIVFIVQENRSFDNLFQAYPGADTASTGKTSDGKTVTLATMSLRTVLVIDHSAQAMFESCNGTGKLPGTKCRMNGFNKETVPPLSPPNAQYVYVPHNESKPYFDMAREGVLADRMFPSQLDFSFVAHQYAIAAQAQSSVNAPIGPWGCSGGKTDTVATITKDRNPNGAPEQACFDYQTLGDELDQAKLPWRFYTSEIGSPGEGSLWSAYGAVRHIYHGPDWKTDMVTPQKRFLRDVAAGKLATFTWITPICSNSDHSDCGGGYGPSWVAAVVNQIGESEFWNSTAIFILWDDWGGFYDHVPPPFRDYDGLGIRVPLLIMSPYAKQGYISHVQYETASVLRFAEDTFGLDQLAAADTRATSPAADCFDFMQKPRAFVPIKAPYGRDFFLHQAPDYRIPDYE